MRRSTSIEINVSGGREFARELLRFNVAALNMAPAFEEIIEELRDWARAQYRTHGFRSNDPWRPLKPATLLAKARRSLDPGILMATHRLYDSLTTSSPDAIADFDKNSLEFGSDVPYFKYHQSRRQPRTKIPRRPIIALTEIDKHEVVQILQRHIIGLRRGLA